MIAEVKLDIKNVVAVVVMQDTTIDGNNGLNKVMNNAIQLTTDAIISVFDYVGYDLDYPDGRKALDTFLKMKDLVFSNTTDDVSFGPISVSIDVYQICD